MFTHRKNDLLTMGQKYNVKKCAHLNLQKSNHEHLVRFFWVIWCTYYQICKNHGSQLPKSMCMIGMRIHGEQQPFISTSYLYVVPFLTVFITSLCQFFLALNDSRSQIQQFLPSHFIKIVFTFKYNSAVESKVTFLYE